MDKGARNLHDLQKQLGVSTQCGRCAGCARDMLSQRDELNSKQKAAVIHWIGTPVSG